MVVATRVKGTRCLCLSALVRDETGAMPAMSSKLRGCGRSLLIEMLQLLLLTSYLLRIIVDPTANLVKVVSLGIATCVISRVIKRTLRPLVNQV